MVEPGSFITLQVLLTIESYYMTVYGCYLVLIHLMKVAGGLRYPPHIWPMEFAAIIFFILMQVQRINLGMLTNRNEHPRGTLIFAVFTVCCLLCYLYFTIYTTYVLILDIVSGFVGVLLTAIQAVLGVAAYIVFRKRAKL